MLPLKKIKVDVRLKVKHSSPLIVFNLHPRRSTLSVSSP